MLQTEGGRTTGRENALLAFAFFSSGAGPAGGGSGGRVSLLISDVALGPYGF